MAKEVVPVLASIDFIATKILYLRGEKVLLDSDLALLYGIETRVLKQSVRRNIGRFPGDFLFELSSEDWVALRSQNVTLKKVEASIQNTHPSLSRNKELPCFLVF